MILGRIIYESDDRLPREDRKWIELFDPAENISCQMCAKSAEFG